MRAPEDWTVDGVVDARQLPVHIQRGNLAAVLHLVGRVELCRRWVLANAAALLEHQEHFRISPRDARFLACLCDGQTLDEGIVRFAIIDLNWRRRIIEPQLRAGHVDNARRSLAAYFTSTTSMFLRIFDDEDQSPILREHLATLARAYSNYLAQCDAVQGATHLVPWPFTGLADDGRIDEAAHVKLTLKWAKKVLSFGRRIREMQVQYGDRNYHPLERNALPIPVAPTPVTAPDPATHSNSQDSLPTPDPSSDDGRRPASQQPVVDQPGGDGVEVLVTEAGTEDTPMGERDEEPFTQAAEVAPVVRDEDARMDIDVHVPASNVQAAPRAPPAPTIALQPVASPPPSTKRKVRDSSVQTSPLPSPPRRRSPRLSPSPHPELASISPRRYPHTRTRSPAPHVTPLATLTVPAPSVPGAGVDAAEPASSQPPRVPAPNSAASAAIASLITQAAAQTQARLLRERRATMDALWPVPEQETEDEAGRALDESREKKRPRVSAPAAVPEVTRRPVGLTSSAVLMPPPASTARSTGRVGEAPAQHSSGSTGSSALPSSGAEQAASAPPAQAMTQTLAEAGLSSAPSSQGADTAPLALSGGSSSQSQSRSQSQSQSQSQDAPAPGQHEADRTGPLPSLPGFTASTARSSPAASAADALEVPVPGQATSLAADADTDADAAGTSGGAGAGAGTRTTQDSESSSGSQAVVSDSQPSSGGAPVPPPLPALAPSSSLEHLAVPVPVPVPVLVPVPTPATAAQARGDSQTSGTSSSSGLTYLSRRAEEALVAAAEAASAERVARERQEQEWHAQASEGILDDLDDDDDNDANLNAAEDNARSVSVARAGTQEEEDELALSQALPLSQTLALETQPFTQAVVPETQPSASASTQALPAWLPAETQGERALAADTTDSDGPRSTTSTGPKAAVGRARRRSLSEVGSEDEQEGVAGEADEEGFRIHDFLRQDLLD
ncbi:hypothetical protein JCM3770_001853 [Rhodotorula araucariae]